METNGGEIATWVCLSHDVLSFHLFAASECGFPGVPSNGSLVGSSMLFHPGEEASYLCHEGFVLFGDDKRTCSENGTWNGPMPNCREYIHYITALRIRSSAIFCQIFSQFSGGGWAGPLATYCLSRSRKSGNKTLRNLHARSDAQRCTVHMSTFSKRPKKRPRHFSLKESVRAFTFLSSRNAFRTKSGCGKTLSAVVDLVELRARAGSGR